MLKNEYYIETQLSENAYMRKYIKYNDLTYINGMPYYFDVGDKIYIKYNNKQALLHREDGPAIELKNDALCWYSNGLWVFTESILEKCIIINKTILLPEKSQYVFKNIYLLNKSKL